MRVRIAESDEEIGSCFSVMKQLRPHFLLGEEFLGQVKRQMLAADFGLVYLEDDGVKAVGSYRIGEWLGGGRYLEIEDLVVKEGERSKGYGGKIFDWMMDFARAQECVQIKLVSRTTREMAHKFYLAKGMAIEAYYFSIKV